MQHSSYLGCPLVKPRERVVRFWIDVLHMKGNEGLWKVYNKRTVKHAKQINYVVEIE